MPKMDIKDWYWISISRTLEEATLYYNCTLANLMAMQYDDGYNQRIDSIYPDGGYPAPVAFAPPRTRSVMGMRRMAPGAYGSTTGGSVHLRLAGTRHRHRSGPRHTLLPRDASVRPVDFVLTESPACHVDK